MNKIIAKLNSLTGGLYETSKWELTASQDPVVDI